MKRILTLLLALVMLCAPAALAEETPMEKMLTAWHAYLDVQEERLACKMAAYNAAAAFTESRHFTHLIKARSVYAGSSYALVNLIYNGTPANPLTAMEAARMTMQGKDLTAFGLILEACTEGLYNDWIILDSQQLELYMPWYTEESLQGLAELMKVHQEYGLIDAAHICLMTNALYLMMEDGEQLWAAMPASWPTLASAQQSYALTEEEIEHGLMEIEERIKIVDAELVRIAGEDENIVNRMAYDIMQGDASDLSAGAVPLAGIPVVAPMIPWVGLASDSFTFFRMDDDGNLLATAWNDPLDGYILLCQITTENVKKEAVVAWAEQLKELGAVCTYEEGDPADKLGWMCNLNRDTSRLMISWEDGKASVLDVGCQVFFGLDAAAETTAP